MRNKYTVEKRIADDHFIYTIPGIDYAVGDTYYVLIKYTDKNKEGYTIAWSRTEEGAWACKY